MSTIFVLRLTPRPSENWKGFVWTSERAYRTLDQVQAELRRKGLDEQMISGLREPETHGGGGFSEWHHGWSPQEGRIAKVAVSRIELIEP